jgi:tetratricopeptide (TPR) repeat protein/predicted Ser/Thr protein kinase
VACLDANFIAQYFDLELTPAETDRLFSHIDACAACAQLFADTVVAQRNAAGPTEVDPSGSTMAEPAGRTTPGRRRRALPESRPALGKYEVERILGMGGMGVVYAARDPELDRKVAIKLLRPDSRISASTLRARLGREAQAMARLSHPNVINVYEIGTHGEQVFVVMELIDGVTLGEWLRDNERSWREIVQAFVAAGEGLAAAHRAGVVHRDFKPDNVLISREGRVCVTDFGLARIARSDSDPAAAPSGPVKALDTNMTYSGLLVGTPAYMAPEQMRGEPTDARADLFSFCVALYEALYGTRPFLGDQVDELRAAVERGKLAAPKRVVGPSEHRRAIERGLRSRPDERPASMGELLAILRVDPIARRRRRIAIAAAGVAAIAVAAGFVQLRRRTQLCLGGDARLAGIWDAQRRNAVHAAFIKTGSPAVESIWQGVARALDRYTSDWVAQRERVCEATRIRGEQSEALLDVRMQCLDDRLDEVRALTDVLMAADVRTLDRTADAVHALSSFADCAHLQSANAPRPVPAALKEEVERLKRRTDDAAAHERLGRAREAVDITSSVLAEPATAEHAPLRAQALAIRGTALIQLARLPEATAALKGAARTALESHEDARAVGAWLGLADIAGDRLEHLDEGLEWAALAGSMIVRLGRPNELELRRLITVSHIYEINRKFAESEAAARSALALTEGRMPVDEVTLAEAYDTLAGAIAERAPEESAALTERAIALLEHNGGGETTAVANKLYNLALTYDMLRREQDVERLMRRALAIHERVLDADHPSIVMELDQLGTALVDLGRFDEAEPVLQRALPLAIRRKEEIPVGEPEILWRLGMIQGHRHHYNEAIELLEKALAHPSVSADSGEVKFALAQVLWDAGRDRSRARALAAQAKTELKDVHPNTVPYVDGWLSSHPPRSK